METPDRECGCRECSMLCRMSPGFLVPGDMERIVAKHGPTADDPHGDWEAENFAASPGSLLKDTRGNIERVPLIVPRQWPDGSCVFLAPDGKCSIYDERPWMCRKYHHSMGVEQNAAAAREGFRLARNGPEVDYYQKWWMFLFSRNSRPMSRRRRLKEAKRYLKAMERDAREGGDDEGQSKG